MSFTSPRWRDVYVLAAASGVSAAGDFLASTALLLALQGAGAGGPAVAALLLAATVPPIAVAPLAGRLVDRYSSRVLLTTVSLGQAAVAAALAFAKPPGAIIGLMALLATGRAITMPTRQALVPEIVGERWLARASGILQGVVTVGMLAGPALAGLLVGRYGVRVPLLLDAATYLALAAAGLAMHTVRHGASRTPGERPAGGGGLAVLRRDPLLLGFMVVFTAGIAVLTMDNVVGVFLVRGTLHATPTTYGLLEATWMLAMLAGTWLLVRWRLADAGLVLLVAGFVAMAGMVQIAAGSVPAARWLFPLYLIGGVANGAQNVAQGVLLGRRVPEAVRGRAFAAAAGVLNAAIVVGYVCGGVLLGPLGPRAVYRLSGAAALVLVAVLALPLLRVLRGRAGRPVVAVPEVAQATAVVGVR